MSGFTRRWVRFLFGVVALALVSICTREAKAYPGATNVDGSPGAGYITSNIVDPGLGGCSGCHGTVWTVAQLSPALTISGAGTSTTHGTNSDGSGGIFTVRPGSTATFNLTFQTLAVPGAGGFLVYHSDLEGTGNAGSNNSAGTLFPIDDGTVMGVSSEHSCKEDVPDALCGGAGDPTPDEIPGNNTEVMHARPQVTSNGQLSFNFGYTPPAVCAGSFTFRLWYHAVNGDSNCGTPDSSDHFDFTINIASCNDGNACNGVESCSGGSCAAGTAPNCNDFNACTNDSCSPASGCQHGNVGNGTGCPDGNLCNGNETCQAGTCTAGAPPPTNDGNICTADGCTPGGGVFHTPLTGTSCSDGNACNGVELCSAGACAAGTAPNCNDGNACTSDSCSPGSGCVNAAVAPGTSCSDGNACNGLEICSGTVCQPGNGPSIDDGNPCTTDGCNSGGGVFHTPLTGTSCSDGNACNGAEMCNAGTCTAGPAPNCNDGFPCTTDSCDPTTGCKHPFATGTQCSPPSCNAGVAIPPGQCDGTHAACPAVMPISCGGAVCNGNACSGGCNGDDSLCAAGNFCLSNVCTPKRTDGTTCNADNYCSNGHCVDGVCCNTACGGNNQTDCQVCTTGVCTNPVGTLCRPADPTKDCDAPEVCTAGNPACPTPDLPVPAAAKKQCRASGDGNLCDPPETCDGTSFTCPPNTATRDGVECRKSAGVCDPHETCLGNNCPANTFQGNVSCRAASCSSGTATAAANCPGNAASCPAIVNTDCTPYVCQGTACGTTCNAKTDCDIGFYCNPAKKCVPELPPGGACTTPESCGTGICVDGRCCNSQCTGQCQACDVPNKLGICSPVPATDKVPHGTRPKCTGDTTTCHGFCDGTITATCAMPGATTQCVAPTCTGGVATPVEVCNGSGTCPTHVPVPCAPGICQAASGPKAICVGGGGTPCVSDVECLSDHFCLVGQCKPKNPNGGTCAADDQCTNGHCVDGLCCNSSCGGQCEACDVSGKEGVCSPVTAADTPHSGRQACTSDPQFLDCAGQCDGKNRLSCVYPGAGTLCRDASCTKDIATLPAYCTGTGTCSPPQQQACDTGAGCDTAGTICKNGCTADRDCSMGKYCAGGVCVPSLPTGGPCSEPGQCAGGLCVDGVCCLSSCDHQCEACNVEGKLGICTAVTGAPVLPRAACATDGTPACTGKCNGVNHDACTYPGSTTKCGADPVCADGVATVADFCDGAGSCPPAQHQICAPADCSGTKCGGACAVSGTCPAGNYCSAGVCVPKLPPKSTCNQDTDCANGICTDGFCCDSACTGQCQACDVPGSQGVCTTVTGDSPHGGRAACAGFGSCGALCDGADPATCHYAPATTTCGKSTCAVDGEQLSAPLCNGQGACLPAASKNCGAYTCDPSSGICQISCVLGSDCAPGFECVNAKCTQGNDAGVDSGAGGAPDMPDASTPDASTDGAVPDTGTDAADTGAGGESDGGLVPPSHSTDKGSCGCRVPGSERGPSNALLFASALTLLAAAGRRRRRRSAPRSGSDVRP